MCGDYSLDRELVDDSGLCLPWHVVVKARCICLAICSLVMRAAALSIRCCFVGYNMNTCSVSTSLSVLLAITQSYIY